MVAEAAVLGEQGIGDRPSQRRYEARVAQLLASVGRENETQVREMLRLLADVRRGLMDELAAVPQDAGSWPAYRLRTLLSALDEAAAAIERQYGLQLRDGVTGAWDAGAAFLPDALAAAGIDLTPTGISRHQLEVAMHLQADLVRKVSHDFRQRAGREITLVVAGARTPAQAQQSVRELLRTQPTRTDPRLGTVTNQAERIVRTELMTAFNLANEVRQREVAAEVPELRKYWRSARDARVRETHATADARYRPGGSQGPIAVAAAFSVGGEQVAGPHAPNMSARNRVHCRCVSVSWQPGWD